MLLTTHLNAGGITSYLQTLCRGLTADGHGVWLVSSGGERAGDFQAMGCRLVTRDIKTKSEVSPKIYAVLGELKDIILREKIEVLHAHTRITQVMAAWLRRMSGRPNIATCHGFFKTRWNRRLFPCWGIRTIAISEPVVRHLTGDFRCPPETVKLIPNGIDLERFFVAADEDRTACRERHGLGDEPVVGIIARLSDVKGIDILIETIPRVKERIPEVKLVIMGEGREEQALKDLVRQRHLEGTVRFFSGVDDMALCLNMFDVFVMPSRQEGLGLSVLEAQACGLCVVASRVGGLVSIIEDGETGFLVDPEDPAVLAARITAVLTDDFTRRKVGRQARARVGEHHAASRMVAETVKVYREVI
ncbi:MAG: glycosyltransferase family 4 protein [Candidatus Omnitrophica bacterium]|nr:glycosyltransferase family 4 protein [Candidatus Omnitrophota bacterium]